MSDMALTYPVLEGSVWMAGVGVNACDPSLFSSPVNLPRLNVPAPGQVVMVPLPWGLVIHRMSLEVDSALLALG